MICFYIFYLQTVTPVVRVPMAGNSLVVVTEKIGDVDTAVTAFWPAVCVRHRASFAVHFRVRLAVAVAIDRS